MDTDSMLFEFSEDEYFVIEEALRRCAGMDEGLSKGYLSDAEKCEQSSHPSIKARSADLRKRAEEFRLSAEKYRNTLSFMG